MTSPGTSPMAAICQKAASSSGPGWLPSARTACLKNHRLAFNLHAGKAIYANIVPCYRSIVWGAAYWCSREMMDALDRYEGVVDWLLSPIMG